MASMPTSVPVTPRRLGASGTRREVSSVVIGSK
jgi:hypothetical protein